ncbi:GW dipeptide domain-containing protein [Siminovitchia fortis]|uniref:GW dipeptide domain-containing protein n=1 Tax=Siminovitchia fortis TaxID=254758 RepID=UPI0016428C5D|nr:GW dipeptide domain-containing protein [Siminovitchia fortis]
MGAVLATVLAFPPHYLAENNTLDTETDPENINVAEQIKKGELAESEVDLKLVDQNNSDEDIESSTNEIDNLKAKTNQQMNQTSEEDPEKIESKSTVEKDNVEDNSSESTLETFKDAELQTFSLKAAVRESSTSKLGRIQNANAGLYRNVEDKNPFTTAGTEYTDRVFYIKKQAEANGQQYYLISTVASSTRGVLGWVKADDMWAQNHVGVDKQAKTFILKGTGWAYTDAWGAGKDVIYRDLTPYKDQTFKVNLTEKVGNYIWYRGELNGRSVWIQAGNVTKINENSTKESSTSKLGRIQNANAGIYKNIGDRTPYTTAGTKYTDKVFYIKKQAEINGQQYYLISTVASSTNGVIGWVKAEDMWAQNHVGVDKQAKTFILKGTGWAYTDAWGAGKDVIYRDLTPYKNQTFKVNLTEKVGNYIWYRGELNGRLVWIQAGNVTTIKENSTSKLGRIQKTETGIYKNIGDQNPFTTAGAQYTDKVFYIKKQADLNGQQYYLISTVASSTNGVIGWVKAGDMWAQNHVGVDKQTKTFILKGTGWAYTDAWGAGKDVIYRDLSPYKNQAFKVNLTEKVGNYIWYRGELNGKLVWIQASNINTSNIFYTNYNLTFKEALDKQMSRSPQTDKYRNNNGYIQSSLVDIKEGAVITGDPVNLRTSPGFGQNVWGQVNRGAVVDYLGQVKGDLHEGSTVWYMVSYNGQILYVHSCKLAHYFRHLISN